MKAKLQRLRAEIAFDRADLDGFLADIAEAEDGQRR